MYDGDDELFFCESLRYHTCAFSTCKRLRFKHACERKVKVTGPQSFKTPSAKSTLPSAKSTLPSAKSTLAVVIPMMNLYPVVKKMLLGDPSVSIESLFTVCSIVFGIEQIDTDLHRDQICRAVKLFKKEHHGQPQPGGVICQQGKQNSGSGALVKTGGMITPIKARALEKNPVDAKHKRTRPRPHRSNLRPNKRLKSRSSFTKKLLPPDQDL